MEERKKNHIDMAFDAQTPVQGLDTRFSYEPMLSGHPLKPIPEIKFLGKTFRSPLWVSSMTGGTQLAKTINTNLAQACKEFGFGMGLGSCRILLEDPSRFSDFNMRPLIGDENVLYANMGIAQIEQSVKMGKQKAIHEVVNRLQADGLIIHVNPLQEWVQPEGDLLIVPPIETITRFLEKAKYPVIVKEVGQGYGKESMRALLKLPLEAIEFAAFGGTNFARLELHRRPAQEQKVLEPFSHVGADANLMVDQLNQIVEEEKDLACHQVIISGGVKSFLDGYYLTQKSKLKAIYGQASAFLEFAKGDYKDLHAYVKGQVKGLAMARTFLRIKE